MEQLLKNLGNIGGLGKTTFYTFTFEVMETLSLRQWHVRSVYFIKPDSANKTQTVIDRANWIF